MLTKEDRLKKSGFKQTDIAKFSGRSAQDVSHFFNDRQIGAESYEHIARVFERLMWFAEALLPAIPKEIEPFKVDLHDAKSIREAFDRIARWQSGLEEQEGIIQNSIEATTVVVPGHLESKGE